MYSSAKNSVLQQNTSCSDSVPGAGGRHSRRVLCLAVVEHRLNTPNNSKAGQPPPHYAQPPHLAHTEHTFTAPVPTHVSWTTQTCASAYAKQDKRWGMVRGSQVQHSAPLTSHTLSALVVLDTDSNKDGGGGRGRGPSRSTLIPHEHLPAWRGRGPV